MGLIASAERLDKHLLPYIESVQEIYSDRLLLRGRLCGMAADLLSVTKQAVSARIAKAVAEERLIEIFPRADWLVRLVEGDDLPRLFAVNNTAARVSYDLLSHAPLSRGAGGASFIITPDGLKKLLSLTRKRLGVPEPDGMDHFTPVIERRVRPDDYEQMQRILLLKYTGNIASDQVCDILDDLLSVLKLNPPQG